MAVFKAPEALGTALVSRLRAEPAERDRAAHLDALRLEAALELDGPGGNEAEDAVRDNVAEQAEAARPLSQP